MYHGGQTTYETQSLPLEFRRGNKMACLCVFSHIQLFVTPMDCRLPGSSVHGIFFQQEYWSGLPFPPPRYHGPKCKAVNYNCYEKR